MIYGLLLQKLGITEHEKYADFILWTYFYSIPIIKVSKQVKCEVVILSLTTSIVNWEYYHFNLYTFPESIHVFDLCM